MIHRLSGCCILFFCLLNVRSTDAAELKAGSIVLPRSVATEWNSKADGTGDTQLGESAGIPWFLREVRGERLFFNQSGRAGWCDAADVVALEDAVAHFDSLIENKPTYLWALNLRATANHRLNNLDAAVADYDRMLGIEESAAAFMNRGMVYEDLGRDDAALEDYTQALRVEPDYSQALTKRGGLLINSDPEQALKDLNRSAELSPVVAQTYFFRARAHSKGGDSQAAYDDYSLAIELNPYHDDAYNNRGNILLGKGELDEAIIDFSIAIRLAPGDSMPVANRADAFFRKGLPEVSLLDIKAALERDSDLKYLYRIRAMIHGDRGDYLLAIADMDIYLASYPDDDFEHLRRARFYNAIDDYETGLAGINKAIEMDPDYAEYHFEKGKTLSILERHEEGRDLLTKAIELTENADDKGRYFLERGKIFRRLNDLESALPDLQKAREQAPDDHGAAHLLGATYLKLNRYDEALKELEAAHELYDSAYTYRELAYLLAVHPEETQRDPARALELVEELVAEGTLNDAEFCQVFAAVFAANDDFKNAILWQKRAIEEVPESLDEAAERLKLYEAGTPFHLTLDLP